MGQKVHPYGFRLGYTKTWNSRWFAKQGYASLLKEDLELKEMLRARLKAAFRRTTGRSPVHDGRLRVPPRPSLPAGCCSSPS